MEDRDWVKLADRNRDYQTYMLKKRLGVFLGLEITGSIGVNIPSEPPYETWDTWKYDSILKLRVVSFDTEKSSLTTTLTRTATHAGVVLCRQDTFVLKGGYNYSRPLEFLCETKRYCSDVRKETKIRVEISSRTALFALTSLEGVKDGYSEIVQEIQREEAERHREMKKAKKANKEDRSSKRKGGEKTKAAKEEENSGEGVAPKRISDSDSFFI